MGKLVLIVDDDPTQRRLLQAVAEREGFDVVHADSGEKALEVLTGPQGARIDVTLLDLVMPGLGGLEALKEMKERLPELPVIVLTAQAGTQTVVDAMRAGASDFMVKPASPERIVVSIRNALRMGALSSEVTRLKKTASNALSFDDMIANARPMRQVVRMGRRAAQSNIPILITGESGVGKELVARAIQGESDRAGKPFITVNCGAIPENLVESILFGHKKGSFTGATADHVGKFKEADGGTLFLDEVGELPLDMQVKLLRALQEGEVDPVGAKRPVKVDVRIISATNRDMLADVKAGRFREDLYYRLNVFPIEVPPLRSRKADLGALVEHFIARFNVQEGRDVKGVAPDTLAMIEANDWPGNVRQLENSVFRAVVLCEGDLLQPHDFPQISGITAPSDLLGQDDEADTGSVVSLASATGSNAETLGQSAPFSFWDGDGHLRRLEDIERDLIQFAIQTYSGHMSEVARRLGIGRSTLYRKARTYEIAVEGARQAAG